MHTHAHSPGPANQGEDYPPHLRNVIGIYAELMKQPAETATPTASAQNYSMQERIIGVASPIGLATCAPARFSTRDQNVCRGLNLVQRHKSGRAYVEESDGGDLSPTKLPPKKSKKVDVREILANQNDSRNEMRSAIINLTSSMKPNEVTAEELSFKKECWNNKKTFIQEKFRAKYTFRER